MNKNTVRCTECPADFTHIPSVNGCYKLVNRNLKWDAAGLECRSLHKDAHLLVINDAAEQLAVAGMLASINRQFILNVLHCMLLEFRLITSILLQWSVTYCFSVCRDIGTATLWRNLKRCVELRDHLQTC